MEKELAYKNLKEKIRILENRVEKTARLERSLLLEKEFYKNIIETSHAIIIGLDKDHIIKSFNNGAEKITGYLREEVIGKDWFEIFFSNNILNEMNEAWRNAWGKSSHSYINPIITKDGEVKIISWRSKGMYEYENTNQQLLLSVGEDISDQKKSRQALSENKKKIQGLFNGMSSGVVFCEAIYDKSKKMVDCIFRDMNTVYEKFTNLKKENAIGKKVSEMLPGTETEWFSTFGEVVISGNPISFDMYHEYSKKHYSVFAYRSDKDEFAAIFDDITIRKETEETLKESEERYRLLTETMKDVVIRISPSGTLLYVSPTIKEFGGYNPEIEMGNNISKYFSKKKDLKRATKLLSDVVINHKSGVFEFLFKPKIKVPFRVEHTYVPLIKSGKVIAIQMVLRDITQRKREEEIMLKNSRMEATATLAAGIAHDFNNLMVGVLGNADLLKIKYINKTEVVNKLNTIIDSAQKAGELAQQLLAFARGGKYHPKTANLNEIILEALRSDECCFPQNKKIEQELEPYLFNITVDRSQLKHVIINLCINAAEAIEKKGKIIISTNNVKIEEKAALTHPQLKKGNYVCLTIEDTGCGMTNNTLSKIFEPFFSTKFTGRGLGMAAVYGIIENHAGYISIKSEIGKGTICMVYLPAGKLEVLPKPESKNKISTGTETILIIDDEPLVLDISRNILENFGYNVLHANNGREAVNIAQDFDGTIHMAILDMGMPVLCGKDTFPLLKKIYPQLKVIICSGYELDENAQSVLDAGANLFIQKPFRLEDFTREVRKILDAI